MWIERLTIGDVLDDTARRFADREALVADGKRWTWRELAADIDRVARALIRIGVEPGDRVALWSANRPEWIHLFFAIIKIGAIAVPLKHEYTLAEAEYVVRHTGCRLRFTAEQTALPSLLIDDPTWAAGGVSQAELAARQRAVDPNATAVILHTGGTTGAPKSVMHGHAILRNVIDQANRLAIRSTDATLLALPMYHGFGLYEGPLMSVVTGARLILSRPDAGAILELVERERATLIHGFDPMFHELMAHPELARRDLSSLRTGIIAAGLASSEPTARRAIASVCRLVSAWGMTETGPGATLGFPTDSDDDRALGSGAALPSYDVQVVDPRTRQPVPYGHEGELCLRGPAVLKGYYGIGSPLDDGGWLATGDRATLREDGTIRYLGRYRELLNVGGLAVDPFEIEAMLLQHPAVAQAKVVGVPSGTDEVPCACVIVAQGARVDAEELMRYCDRVGHVLFVTDYPMTPTGRVQKFKLRERCVAALA